MRVVIVLIIDLLVVLFTNIGAPAAEGANPPLPLKVSDTGRYLVDQQNHPFLVVGDTPWSLIAQLSEPDINRYLEDRHQRGFNSILVNLIEHKFATAAPRTKAGLAPFSTPGDFSTPNPAYFDFAHQVVEKARQYGIVVWLAPAYLGYGGGDEGFFHEMKASGQERLRHYGRFVGQRFKDLPNIIWVLGGDYTPEKADQWTVTELAAAVRSEDPIHLMTVHASPEHSAAAVFGTEPWLSVDTVYSYEPTLFRSLLAEYRRTPARPFVLIESTYEGEHNSTPPQIRRQAYWAMLGGACGQFLGNNPLWHFDGPGLFPAKETWIQALDSTGSRDMSRLGALFRQLPWSNLVPDEGHSVITDGYGRDLATALTARTPDRKFSVTYTPSTSTDARELTIDAAQFAGPVRARWFDPASGTYQGSPVAPFANRGLHRVQTPGDNGTQANDWVLILDVAGDNSK
jgi:hypothetical protein